MFCSQCGQQNDDTGSFCVSCGASLVKAAAPPVTQPQESMQQPPMREPMQQQSKQFSQQPSASDNARPYKTEFVLGLIGSILGAIFFVILIAIGTNELSYNTNDAVLIIVVGIFTLAAFILGFIGIGLLKKVNPAGGVLLVVGGGLGFVAMFFSYIGPITMFYYPLILAGGIVALARRKHVERNFPQG